jgi:hypothetical protein
MNELVKILFNLYIKLDDQACERKKDLSGKDSYLSRNFINVFDVYFRCVGNLHAILKLTGSKFFQSTSFIINLIIFSVY